MPDLSAFPITARWPAKYPEKLQLYSLPTPNGVKVSIMLEEIGLPYEVHLVAFNKDDQKAPEFLSLNPHGKIPAIIDPNGPGGKPLGPFESGALLHGVMERRLSGRRWMMDDEYTIADNSLLGWVRNLIGFYGARELVAFDRFGSVSAWLERGLARPPVQRGLEIPKRP